MNDVVVNDSVSVNDSVVPNVNLNAASETAVANTVVMDVQTPVKETVVKPTISMDVQEFTPEPEPELTTTTKRTTKTPKVKLATERMTGLVPVDIVNRVKNYCYHNPETTLTNFLTNAVLNEITRIEKEFNEGQMFPGALGKLKTGRRVTPTS